MNSPYISQFRLTKGISKYLDLQSHQKTLSLHYDLLKNGIEDDSSMILTEVIMPSEIFYAMGLTPIFVESLGSFLASVKMNDKIIKKAENLGVNQDICAYHKCVIGALSDGYIPYPKAFVHSSYWCDDMIKVGDYLASQFKQNVFNIDIPFHYDEDAVDYVANQFEELTHYLEKVTGHTFDMEKLKEAFRYSNEAREYWVKANKLREESPCLMYGSDAMQMLPMLLSKLGHPEAVDVLKTFYEELLYRRENPDCGIGKERFRLLWLHFFPFYDINMMRYIEKELGAVIAFEENCNVYWEELDENEPFRSLAKKIMQHTGFGSASNRVKAIQKFVEQYKIDGVVHFSQTCCRPFRGSVSFIRDALREDGVPFLELSGDVLDSRNYSEGQLKIRIDAFIEMLQN
nr:2-hydroxyacyl-CoA dehydratase family protein [uncultured Lachnoclostridium sp.]